VLTNPLPFKAGLRITWSYTLIFCLSNFLHFCAYVPFLHPSGFSVLCFAILYLLSLVPNFDPVSSESNYMQVLSVVKIKFAFFFFECDTVPVRCSFPGHGKLDQFGGSETLTTGNIHGLAT